MFASNRELVGIRLRSELGGKFAVKRSRLGLFMAELSGSGLLWVTEGESDCAAALSLGLEAVGIPGAGQATRDLVCVAAARGRSRRC